MPYILLKAIFSSLTLYVVILKLEATPGFEPGIKALQAHALPLGHVAVLVVPETGLEPVR